MEKRKVAWIIGTSFCGSSLLNLLLDSQPTIRGLGEGTQVYFRNPDPAARLQRLAGGPCARCKSTVAQCELYRQYQDQPFYQFNFDHYGCRVLVDSSKAPRMLRTKPFEPSFRYFAIVLSKTPHEAAYSWRQHARWDTWSRGAAELASVEAGFQEYLWRYGTYLEQVGSPPVFGLVHVRYADVACAPGDTIRRLCEFLDEPFCAARLAGDWRATDTHVLGGNPAIVAQISGDDGLAFVIPPSLYLDGKYADKAGKIFYDQAWRRDAEFLEACRREYRRREPQLRQLLPRLGYEFDALLDDLERPSA